METAYEVGKKIIIVEWFKDIMANIRLKDENKKILKTLNIDEVEREKDKDFECPNWDRVNADLYGHNTDRPSLMMEVQLMKTDITSIKTMVKWVGIPTSFGILSAVAKYLFGF